MKEIEGEFGLREKLLVPKEVGEGFGEAGEDAEEVDFEGLDGTLDGVAAMDAGRHELIGAVPVFVDGLVVLCAGLVVEKLVFHDMVALFELDYDASVGCNVVAVMFGLEGFD